MRQCPRPHPAAAECSQDPSALLGRGPLDCGQRRVRHKSHESHPQPCVQPPPGSSHTPPTASLSLCTSHLACLTPPPPPATGWKGADKIRCPIHPSGHFTEEKDCQGSIHTLAHDTQQSAHPPPPPRRAESSAMAPRLGPSTPDQPLLGPGGKKALLLWTTRTSAHPAWLVCTPCLPRDSQTCCHPLPPP